MSAAHKLMKCSYCPKREWRVLARAVIECRECRRARVGRWFMAHREALRAVQRQRYQEKREENIQRAIEWNRQHPDKHSTYCKRYRRHERQRNAEVIAEVESLCECGMRHTVEQRAKLLRRFLGADAQEIQEAWPCVWGGSAGARTLYRDLKRIQEAA